MSVCDTPMYLTHQYTSKVSTSIHMPHITNKIFHINNMIDVIYPDNHCPYVQVDTTRRKNL